MTERLYYDDPGLLEFDAVVTDLRATDDAQATLVALDRTAFYPTSGGQPFDTGALTVAGVQHVVGDVQDDDGGIIWHRLASATNIAVGSAVHGSIDIERRVDHRQQHSGQHLLSAVLLDLFGYPTVSFHLGGDSSTIDLAAPALTEQQLRTAADRCNQIIFEDRAIAIHYCTVEEARARGVRKIAPGIERVRVIEITGLEFNACGGTHVNSTGQIGVLLCRSTEKVKQGMRLEFICGKRAARAAAADYDELRRAGALLSSGVAQVAGAVNRVVGDSKRQSKTIQKLESELAAALAPQFASQAEDGILVRYFAERNASFAKLLAQNIVRDSAQQMIVLFAVDTPTPTLICARGEHESDRRLDSAALLRETLALFAGHGGGSPTLAQAGIADAAQLQPALAFAHRLARGER